MIISCDAVAKAAPDGYTLGTTQEESDAFIRKELARWSGLIKSANIKLD